MTEAETKAAMELQRPLEHVATPLATIDVLPSFASIVEAVKGGGLSPDDIAKLLSVYRELKTDQAEQAYNMAFACFQGECPEIPRARMADIVTKSGARIKYTYADIETIMRTIGPALAKHGLSVSFDDSVVEGNMLTAVCRCSHVGGHSQVSRFSVTTETTAGMSPQQKYGNAATYAQRRALNQRLGLWTGDPDHDGGEPPAPAEKLTDVQQAYISKLVEEVGQDWDALLRFFGVANLSEATQDKYAEAVRGLEQKRAQQTKGKAS